ncbi:3-phosphoshikimate 1-carboxyvinyltransferase [Flavobacteriaceae bacterium S356]|uniref:3-phosphoshikimate 1-carboxyvinyltransferase n=1 Tax=Asprobacillus argus TaxID=3076534 RepID=A0ABU3LFT6_9FLAO|nr:3-phosphoshikimate 1-carboxyvinyltransferase [Flavobacteriaceae bacterium S356]
MDLHIEGVENMLLKKSINVSGSKSESNRLLILQQLFPQITIENLSDSDDSKHLQHAVTTSEADINIGHAGTAMRFLTAFFAMQNDKTVVLSGSHRMHNRPIEILVQALRDLGGDISYVEKEGYPPLKIVGKELTKDSVAINGNVSSQYISALLLIASSLPNGLTITLLGEITSIPYIEMTLSLLNQLGIESTFKDDTIFVKPQQNLDSKTVVVESDWSSASYFYSMMALSDIGSEIKLSSYRRESLQGDSCLAEIYEHFGVETTFEENTITLKKKNVISRAVEKSGIELNLKNAPDIAQTIAVTCFGLGVACELTGLHTLKIKETDRLEALKAELTKLGATVSVTDHSLHLEPSYEIVKNVRIETYHDHRMAMAFVPLAMKVPIQIEDANVVTKSYRNFWEDMKKIGFQCKEL